MKNPFSSQSVLKTRLRSAVSDFEFQLKAMKNKPESHKFTWIPLAEEALEAAKTAIANNENDLAWNHIHIIERLQTMGLEVGELKAKAIDLRNEANKFSSYRKATVLAILKDIENEENIEIIRQKVVQTMLLREGYYNTKYHKLSLRRVSLNFLCLLMTIFIVSIVILSKYYDFTATNIPFHVEGISGTILGALGASFSMSYTLTNESLETKIPEQLLGIFVTILRLAIGATAAFIALLLFHSNLFKSILSADLLSSPFAFSIIAFISGFSERFIVNMMSIVSNEGKSKDKNVKSS